jgi:hypothetical protein
MHVPLSSVSVWFCGYSCICVSLHFSVCGCTSISVCWICLCVSLPFSACMCMSRYVCVRLHVRLCVLISVLLSDLHFNSNRQSLQKQWEQCASETEFANKPHNWQRLVDVAMVFRGRLHWRHCWTMLFRDCYSGALVEGIIKSWLDCRVRRCHVVYWCVFMNCSRCAAYKN